MISFKHNGLVPSSVLAEDGLIARSLSSFEVRPQQLQMAQAICQAFEKNRHLAVEAGTGVGKSFAYLISAIDQLMRKRCKVLISTFTITLQEQLINKDIPFLAGILPQHFTAVLAKGRGNYLCIRRLKFAIKKQANLFDSSARLLFEIDNWARQTSDGSLSDLPFTIPMRLWDTVKSEHGNCRGRKCPHFRNCFYWRARADLEQADIIVANHALLFSDLVLKEQSAGILPDFRYIILDEAHNTEHVAQGHFGINISNRTVDFLLNSLYNPGTHKGILAYMGASEPIGLLAQTKKAAKAFFKQVRSWYEHTAAQTNGRTSKNFVDDCITEPVKKLRLALSKLAKASTDTDEKFELTRYADKCRELEATLTDFLSQSDSESVYWVELDQSRATRISLRSAPVNVGPDLKRVLFDRFEPVILTSATLSTDGADEKSGFDFFAGRIGLEDFDALKLGSPFDFERQVTMFIEPDLPDPNDRSFEPAASEAIKKYIRLTKGKAFILFTSYEMLGRMAVSLCDWLAENNIVLLQQAAGVDRTTLLNRFKADTNSVLFGTESFWQGVDVPGEALSNVIIVRLPFAVPNHPLLQGRIEQIKSSGQNPFFKYQLPQAIIKFKQGFGRLIRNKTDTGIVVILDSRIIRKAYGRQFLSAVPKCRTRLVKAK